jgi:hypothetical protein
MQRVEGMRQSVAVRLSPVRGWVTVLGEAQLRGKGW